MYKNLPEGTLDEIIDGEIFMSPSPTANHQGILAELFSSIYVLTRNKDIGETFLAPFDVFLDEYANAVQPDIVFISKQNSAIVGDDAVHGVPDLLIEITSTNAKHDMVRKKSLYERFGVREHWIVSSRTKESEGFLLENGTYHSLGSFTGKIRSVLLNNTEFTF